MGKSASTPEVLTVAEAAKYMRLSISTIRHYTAIGAIPGQKIGKCWRYLKSELDKKVSGRLCPSSLHSYPQGIRPIFNRAEKGD